MKNIENLGKVWVAGHTGMLGTALMNFFNERNINVLTISHESLDLSRQNDVELWIKNKKPDTVILAAAKVGGIHANNSYPADFIYQNITIQNNVIHACYKYKVKKLVFIGSSCTYPKLAEQPIKEDSLFESSPEITNIWYSTAKLAGIKTIQAYRKQYGLDYIVVMPTNAYGPNDNFDLDSGHVIPALIRKFNDAKIKNLPCVEIWGTGNPLREFIYVDDLAEAIIFLAINYSSENIINVGSGYEISISDLSILIAKIIGYSGQIIFDKSKPDGAMRKALDSSRLNTLGWEPKMRLESGLKLTYDWFLENS